MLDSKSFLSGSEVIKKSKNNIILIGPIGSGKTTLLNKICGENYEVGDSPISITKEVQYSYSLRHDNIIIEFPGIISISNIIPNLRVIKNILDIIPVRMICFVVKCTRRYDEIVHAVGRLLSVFHDYRKNICLLITNSEIVNNENKEDIELIIKKKFGIDKILFSSLKTGGLELRNFCDKLENYKNQMESIEQLIIKTSDLTKNVCEKFIMEDRFQFIDEFKKAIKIFNNEFNKSNDKDLKRALYFGLRDYKDSLIKKYHEVVKIKKDDFDNVIAELIVFNNEIFNEYNVFKKKIEKELNTEIKRFDNYSENVRYKKCPNCGRIWCLVVGSNYFRCGKRTSLRDIIWEKYKTYFVSYINGILNISCKEMDNSGYKGDDSAFFGLTKWEEEANLKRNGKAKIKPEGCGAQLKWDECEDVSEFVIEELKHINDNYAAIISDFANDVNLLIQNEKYEEALNVIFKEKETSIDSIEKKKEFLKKILEKLPELEKKAKELSNFYNFSLF